MIANANVRVPRDEFPEVIAQAEAFATPPAVAASLSGRRFSGPIGGTHEESRDRAPGYSIPRRVVVFAAVAVDPPVVARSLAPSGGRLAETWQTAVAAAAIIGRESLQLGRRRRQAPHGKGGQDDRFESFPC